MYRHWFVRDNSGRNWLDFAVINEKLSGLAIKGNVNVFPTIIHSVFEEKTRLLVTERDELGSASCGVHCCNSNVCSTLDIPVREIMFMRSITDVNRGIKSLIASCCVQTSSLLLLNLLKCKYAFLVQEATFMMMMLLTPKPS